ncbi:MAG: GNAT family N-acetyltransferase [Bacteroidia bacterium]
MEIKIREGTPEDIPAIYALINELALYEKAPKEVITTVEQMYEDGFGENSIYKFVVAEVNNEIVGMALYYWKYSTWKGKGIYLDDIVVTESYRRKGVGKLLMDEIIKIAAREKANKLEWQVLDWNEPAINFYKKYNVEFDDVWINCKLTGEELGKKA